MDEVLQKRLDNLEAKIDAVYKSSEKTRKYFLFIIWASILVIVLPMIGLALVLPSFVNNYLGSFGAF